jgi:proteasome component ECM29
LEQLWECLYRVLDDVNEPVRKVASQLAKAMTSLCLRLCDPKYTTAEGVRQSLAATLPILLNKGIVERVTEVRSVSVNVLLKITAVAGIYLRPHLPGLLRALLEGQSSLEPSAFSYLQFHTAAYNITPEQLEDLRLQMLKSSPLADAVESCTLLVPIDSTCHISMELTNSDLFCNWNRLTRLQ